MEMNLLAITILLPLFGAIFICLFGRDHNVENDKTLKWIGFIISILTLISSLFLANKYNISDRDNYQLIINTLDGQYPLFGIDGISLSLIILTTILTPICFLASNAITQSIKLYICLFLLLESIIIGVFSAIDILLFYILFEVSLIPMYFIIGIWGGDNRIYASFKFFLYTLAGSVLFLAVIIYLFNKTGSFNIEHITHYTTNIPLEVQRYLWLAMFISFAIKIPMFPFHTWLPDAHVQAPTAGSIFLAGILLKLGGYGFVRFLLPMLPDASSYYSDLVCILSIIAVIYGSIVAFAQKDMKKMIAYSSIAHMGYVTIGIFSSNNPAITGALFQMISHGIVSGALFMIIGCLYDRMHTKEISAYGGVATKMPVLALFFMIFNMSAVALPGTSGFVGEILVIIGVFKYNIIYGILIGLGVILGAAYMLSLYARVMFGEINNPAVNSLTDLNYSEKLGLGILAILTILIGVNPSIVTDLFDVSYLISHKNLINNISGVSN